MKPQRYILLVTFLIFVPEFLTVGQQLKYCKMIGKSVNDVVSTYGKPVHQDLSNPDMKCIFYQTKTSRSAFIADKTGVYQIQVDLSFNTKKEAFRSVDDFLMDCASESYQIDTLSIGNYDIKSSGVKMNLSLFENKYAKKYEVKFIANRSELK
jgi:hypothetical protein